MTVALDSSTPAFVSAAADTVTSASFTPPAGSVIYAVAFHDTAGGNTTNTSVVTDSQGLTWSIIRTRNKADSGGQNGHIQVSRAVVSSSTSMTVTTTGTNTGGYCSLRCLVVTGADTSTPVDASDEGSNSSNTVSMTLNTATDGAWAWIANIDWNAAAIPTPNTGVTTDTGVRPGAPNYTAWIAYRTAVTSPAGSVTVDDTAPSSGNVNNYIAWAVKPAAAGGTTPSGNDSGVLSESATVDITGSGVDTGTFSESAAVVASVDSSDAAAFSESADIATSAAGSDSGVFAESGTVDASLSGTDSGTLSESASQFEGGSGADTGTLGESASLTVLISTGDIFDFAESASNPNPNAGGGLKTLVYHLNRLAGSLVGEVPSLTATSAANVWAGTVGLTLEDALNEKAGDSVPTLDVAGALNKIAGTNDLTPVDAISRIT